MHYQVPQFINIEDKIAFQLTAKQLGWFALGGVLLFIIWSLFSFKTFVFLGIIIITVSSALAFIRINGASLLDYVGYSFSFFLKPKIFIWRKTVTSGEGLYFKDNENIKEEKKPRQKKKEIEDLDKIVNILNSQ